MCNQDNLVAILNEHDLLFSARERIKTIAHQLNMEQHVDMAVKFFKLANSKHLTKGRNSVHVAAACLYIVCRILLKPSNIV